MHVHTEFEKLTDAIAPPIRRFGIDGANQAQVPKLAEIGTGYSGDNGGRWGTINTAQGVFADPAVMLALVSACHAAGHKFQFNFLPDVSTANPEWGMDTGFGTFTDPTDGSPHARWLRIKPPNEVHWQDANRFVVLTIPIDAIQIGNEADNQWQTQVDPGGAYPANYDGGAGARGFARATALAYDAIKGVRPEVLVGCSGWNFANLFMPNGFVGGDPAISETAVFFRDWLAASLGKFDYLSLHLNHIPYGYAATVKWVKEQLALNGWDRPIWVDDMASGPFFANGTPTPPWSDPTTETPIYTDLSTNDVPSQANVDAYRILQAEYVVKRAVSAFAAGVERCFLTWDLEKPTYFVKIYRYVHFVSKSPGFIRQPAFYSAQQMVAAIDGFLSCKRIGTNAVRFEMPAPKVPVVIAWSTTSEKLDLSAALGKSIVRAQRVVTTLDGSNNPVIPAAVEGDSKQVDVGVTPVIVQ